LLPFFGDMRGEGCNPIQVGMTAKFFLRTGFILERWNEVVQLADGPLVEVGSHTVTHPVLSKLSTASQWEEIQTTKAFLEKLMGCPITSFAYPFGASDPSEMAGLSARGRISVCMFDDSGRSVPSHRPVSASSHTRWELRRRNISKEPRPVSAKPKFPPLLL
jgi:peptidoglycan/xylan/chitin deacetylase (PgdA/CDA1 family)